jgi:cytochrome bd-type quinol oxidase subunit 1
MGLMGFARSGIRQHWHIYGVMQDRSPDAVTPALGYASNVITGTTILFFLMVMFIFWLGGLGEKGHAAAEGAPGDHAPGAPVPIAGGSPER